jgi:acetamidase/formamidase
LNDFGHAHSFHSLSAEPEHLATVWDNSAPPALEIDSGEGVELECADSSGGQLSKASVAPDIATMDMTKVNPVTGPVFVKGAQPGDTLQIEILELKPATWGWTALIPDFGLLAPEFPDAWLNISEVDAAAKQVHFIPGVTLPFEPFPGTIGVAPQEDGQFGVLPPTRWGGNIDVKHLRPGSTLYLPVGVEGGLFSVGDTHAAMGDAEVCGTAVETAMSIAVRLTVRKDMTIRYPQFKIPQGELARTEASGYHATTGVDGDLMEAAREATRAAVAHIQERHGHTREEAYAIASVACDLRIHEIVDVPNWVVGCFIPDSIFTPETK